MASGVAAAWVALAAVEPPPALLERPQAAGGSVAAAAAAPPPSLLVALWAWRSGQHIAHAPPPPYFSQDDQPKRCGWRWGLAPSVGVPKDADG